VVLFSLVKSYNELEESPSCATLLAVMEEILSRVLLVLEIRNLPFCQVAFHKSHFENFDFINEVLCEPFTSLQSEGVFGIRLTRRSLEGLFLMITFAKDLFMRIGQKVQLQITEVMEVLVANEDYESSLSLLQYHKGFLKNVALDVINKLMDSQKAIYDHSKSVNIQVVEEMQTHDYYKSLLLSMMDGVTSTDPVDLIEILEIRIFLEIKKSFLIEDSEIVDAFARLIRQRPLEFVEMLPDDVEVQYPDKISKYGFSLSAIAQIILPSDKEYHNPIRVTNAVCKLERMFPSNFRQVFLEHLDTLTKSCQFKF